VAGYVLSWVDVAREQGADLPSEVQRLVDLRLADLLEEPDDPDVRRTLLLASGQPRTINDWADPLYIPTGWSAIGDPSPYLLMRASTGSGLAARSGRHRGRFDCQNPDARPVS
jgi:hypothetical protein